MESSSNHMACLLKIESPTKGWDKSLEKLLKTIDDVNFKIDKRSNTVYIYGKIEPQKVIEMITKSGKKVEIIWSDNGYKKPMENKHDQCYSSGSINAPNGLSNYHQQQCNYHQQPNLMNHFQPYPQTFALPPPYTRQLHPQPPPPLPYEFHQNGPVAKSFPPTPPPPKNFTMGDLQLGVCRIM